MDANCGQSKCWAESGLQLLARLDSRPSLVGLDPVLFDCGPNPNDIIEITGDISTGKTLLVTQLLVKCLLPKTWHGVGIGGLNAGAILIDTNHHFQIMKLFSTMVGCLESLEFPPSTSESFSSASGEDIVRSALDNLIILPCYDSTQLFITFHAIERILSSNKNISLLVLDSISTFYWENAADNNGIRKMENYLKSVLTNLQKHVQQFKITTIYTKPLQFQSKELTKSDEKNRGNSDVLVSKKIHLQRMTSGSRDVFTAQIVSSNLGNKFVVYEIDEYSIKWRSTL